MTELKLKIASKVNELLDEALSAEEIALSLEYPPDDTMGDLALPCFKFAKAMRRSPVIIASTLAEGFTIPEVEKATAVGGYLNFKISPVYWASVIKKVLDKGADYGKNEDGKGKVCVLDYSSPNVAKPFHIGHLGTTVIGHALKKLHEFAGYTCVGINHLGDWGTQFGKLITALRRFSSPDILETATIDDLVSIYVKFHEEAEKDPTLNEEARAEFHKMELGDPENIAIWHRIIEISLAEYKKTYDLLGIEFDSYNGEAFYTDKMQEQIDVMREKNLLTLDDGATIVDLDEYKMPPCLILKRDGSTLYPTRDIAAAVYRKRTYDFDKCIYVTSSGQSLHFAQWFKVVELMGYGWADKLVHVPYGTISIGGTKLATRTGNVILLRDLFDTAIEKCLAVINEKNPALENKEEIAKAVGVGAVVFHYLLNGRIKDSDFNMEDALSFDGNTGPYAQYTYARCSSILEKVGDVTDGELVFTAESEYTLAKTLSRFPEVIRAAIRDYEPSTVTRYSLDVATAFNKFYQDCRIIDKEGAVNISRAALVKATGSVLRNALSLICLKTPEKI